MFDILKEYIWFWLIKHFLLVIDSKNIRILFGSLIAFRRNILHKEKDHLANEYEQNMKLLQTKYDADITILKQEHALSASKVVFLLLGSLLHLWS